MRTLSAVELLNVCERGLAQFPAQRALSLLSAACPELSTDSLEQLSIGERDELLLQLRERTFGSQLICLVTCERCSQQLEVSLNTNELVPAEVTSASNATYSFTGDDYEIAFRLPNSLDLTALSDCGSVHEGGRLLLERCVSRAEHNKQLITTRDIPNEVIAALVRRMGEIDHSADIRLSLTCSDCGSAWQSIFDIESFFWKEISAWTTRILREVHTIASTYGWSEADILNMTPWRRQVYLTLLNT